MSFPKAPISRFNETVSCSPSPTKYTPHISNKVKGAVAFDPKKNERLASQVSRSGSNFSSIRLRSRSGSSVGSATTLIESAMTVQINQPEEEVQSPKATVRHPSIVRTVSSARSNVKKPISKKSFSKTTISPLQKTQPTLKSQVERMKRDLQEKQRDFIEGCITLRKLREKMSPEDTQEFIVKCLDSPNNESNGFDTNSMETVVEADLLPVIQNKLKGITNICMDVCDHAVDKTNNILSWIDSIKNKWNAEDVDSKLNDLRVEAARLESALDQTRSYQLNEQAELLYWINVIWQEKEQLKSKQTYMLEEQLAQLEKEKAELSNQLETYKLKRQQKLVDIENELKNAKDKILDIEAKINKYDNQIHQFVRKMTSLETMIQTREQHYEQCKKESWNSIKQLKETLAKTETQRDNLEQRVEDLKQENIKAESSIKDQKLALKKASQKLKTLEEELKVTIEQKQEIEMKSAELMEASEKASQIVASNMNESKPTAYEEELWAKLQSTTVLLKSAQDEIQNLKQEAAAFDNSVKQTLEATDNSAEKMSIMIVKKTNEISLLNEKIKKLNAEMDSKQQTIVGLKLKVQDYENKRSRSASNDRSRKQSLELKHQITELENKVSILKDQNSQLENNLMKLQLELERKEHFTREQEKIIKSRNELINTLKGKGKKTSEEITSLKNIAQEHEKVAEAIKNVVSANGNDLESLHAALEAKQLHIIKLEKLMKKLEEQQDRWAVQRTRHEARIGELENALRDKKRYSYQNHCTMTQFPYQTNENRYLKFNYSDLCFKPKQTHCRQNVHRSRSPFSETYHDYSKSQASFKSAGHNYLNQIINKDTVNIYDISYYEVNTPHIHSHIKHNNIERRHFRSRQHYINNCLYKNVNTIEQEMVCGHSSYDTLLDSQKYLSNTSNQRNIYKSVPSQAIPYVQSQQNIPEKQYICVCLGNKTSY